MTYRDCTRRVERFFADLKAGHGMWLKRRVTVYSVRVFVVAFKPNQPTEDGDDCVYVVTNRAPSAALGFYSQRWAIENLFAALKTRGFNFEDTHLTCTVKLENLLGLLCLTAFWAVQLGELMASCQPIKLKAHGRRAVSVFRAGLDALERLARRDAPRLVQRDVVCDDTIRLLSDT